MLSTGHMIKTANDGRVINVYNRSNLEIPILCAAAENNLMVITYSHIPMVNHWIRQNKVSYKTVVAEAKVKKPKNKAELRTVAVEKLHDQLGNPSYGATLNMVSNGSILNTDVTSRDIINNMELIKGPSCQTISYQYR